jgi:putative DNA primase/helicase
MRDLASPVAAFVRELCIVDSDREIEVDVLYAAFKRWCEENEQPKPSKHVFGRDLRAALPTIAKKRAGSTHRQQVYTGIDLLRKDAL